MGQPVILSLLVCHEIDRAARTAHRIFDGVSAAALPATANVSVYAEVLYYLTGEPVTLTVRDPKGEQLLLSEGTRDQSSQDLLVAMWDRSFELKSYGCYWFSLMHGGARMDRPFQVVQKSDTSSAPAPVNRRL